jgi:hypothetical protein
VELKSRAPFSFEYSVLACLRSGNAGSPSFQRTRRSVVFCLERAYMLASAVGDHADAVAAFGGGVFVRIPRRLLLGASAIESLKAARGSRNRDIVMRGRRLDFEHHPR